MYSEDPYTTSGCIENPPQTGGWDPVAPLNAKDARGQDNYAQDNRLHPSYSRLLCIRVFNNKPVVAVVLNYRF